MGLGESACYANMKNGVPPQNPHACRHTCEHAHHPHAHLRENKNPFVCLGFQTLLCRQSCFVSYVGERWVPLSLSSEWSTALLVVGVRLGKEQGSILRVTSPYSQVMVPTVHPVPSLPFIQTALGRELTSGGQWGPWPSGDHS